MIRLCCYCVIVDNLKHFWITLLSWYLLENILEITTNLRSNEFCCSNHSLNLGIKKCSNIQRRSLCSVLDIVILFTFSPFLSCIAVPKSMIFTVCPSFSVRTMFSGWRTFSSWNQRSFNPSLPSSQDVQWTSCADSPSLC